MEFLILTESYFFEKSGVPLKITPKIPPIKQNYLGDYGDVGSKGDRVRF